MADRLESFIDNDEEFKFEEGVSYPELSRYEEVTDDTEYYITLDDDGYIYCVWSVDKHLEDPFIPEDTDRSEYGVSHSMYYCQERKEWVLL